MTWSHHSGFGRSASLESCTLTSILWHIIQHEQIQECYFTWFLLLMLCGLQDWVAEYWLLLYLNNEFLLRDWDSYTTPEEDMQLLYTRGNQDTVSVGWANLWSTCGEEKMLLFLAHPPGKYTFFVDMPKPPTASAWVHIGTSPLTCVIHTWTSNILMFILIRPCVSS